MRNEVVGKLDAFRFWVGSIEERWSSVWKIWENNGQIYALSTSSAGTTKLSIHSPDSCQIGMVKEFRQRHNYGSSYAGLPTYTRWKRATAGSGKPVPLAVIQFPTDFLSGRHPAPAPRGKKLHDFIEPAPAGKCVELLFLAVEVPVSSSPLVAHGGGYKSILEMPLGTSERCLVVGRYCNFNHEHAQIGKKIEVPNDWTPPRAQNMKTGEKIVNQNLIFWNQPSDFGMIGIVEITGVTLTKDGEHKVLRDGTG